MVPLVRSIQTALRKAADPDKAAPMAAYMKTDMPFYGVQKPQRATIFKEAMRRHAPSTRTAHRAAIEELWSLPHREEKYLAIRLAQSNDEWISRASVALYERMIRQGAWWDLVDDLAIRLVGRVLLKERAALRPRLSRWIDDKDMWIRRTAIIAQIKHKSDTDQAMLFAHCLKRAHEPEFFVRKAIGWALREHAKTAPDEVRRFLADHRDQWSGLTFREASKHL